MVANAHSTIRIKIVEDIAQMDVDAITYAANSGLRHGGGVCGAIFAAAGAEALQRACDEFGSCEEGNAVVTPAFNLKSKIIIHAVGPRWHGGNQGEAKRLYNCYQKSLELACAHNCASIAFPLISSGIFHYPVDQAWNVALTAILDFFEQHQDKAIRVYIAVRTQENYTMGRSILKSLKAQRELAMSHTISRPMLICTHDRLPLMDGLRKNIYEVFMNLDQAASPAAVRRVIYDMNLAVLNYKEFNIDALYRKDTDHLTLEEALVCLTFNLRDEYYGGGLDDPIIYNIKRMDLRNHICKLIYQELPPEFRTYIEHLHAKADQAKKHDLIRILDGDGSVVEVSEMSLKNLGKGHGMMSRFTMTDGKTMDGFLDISAVTNDHPVGTAITIWRILEQPDFNEDYSIETCFVPYRHIQSVDSVLYTHPRWGGIMYHYPIIDNKKVDHR